jgi:hypothetical protein
MSPRAAFGPTTTYLCRAAAAGTGRPIRPSLIVWRERRSGRHKSFSTNGVDALGALRTDAFA